MDSVVSVLAFIERCIVEEGRSPSVLAMAKQLGCSRSTAHAVVRGLVDKGYLEYGGTDKTLNLTEKALVILDS